MCDALTRLPPPVMPPRLYLSVGAAVFSSASSPARSSLTASGHRLFSTSPSRFSTGAHVRSEFTSFFKSKGHLHVASSRCKHPPTPTSPPLLLTLFSVWFHKTHLLCSISPPPHLTTPTTYITIANLRDDLPATCLATQLPLQVRKQRHGAVQTSIRRSAAAAGSNVRVASEVRQGGRQTQRP